MNVDLGADMARRISSCTLLAWAVTIGGDLTAFWYGYRAADSYLAWRQTRMWEPLVAQAHLAESRVAGVVALVGLVVGAVGIYLSRRASQSAVRPVSPP